MSGQLEVTLLSVGELFGDATVHYEVPIYQRNFAWRSEQIDQLIDDVLAADLDPSVDEYFLGNLMLARARRPDSRHVTYEVVDGQQRLTTLFMLLELLQMPRSAKLTYASRRTATEALARPSAEADEDVSGIAAGFKAVRARLERLAHQPEDRATFMDFLADRTRLVRAELPEDTDLNRYFEIMNTRGQQLAQVDIVKARLMSHLRADDDIIREQQACFAWVWDACADIDRYIQMALAGPNTSLRQSIFGEAWDRLEVTSFDDLMTLHRNSDDSVGQRSRPVPIRDALKIYARAAERPAQADDDPGRFESPIRFPQLLLHTLAVMRGTDADSGEYDRYLDDARLIKAFTEEFDGLSEDERSERVKAFLYSLLRSKFILDNFVVKRQFASTDEDTPSWSLRRLVRGERGGDQTGRTRIEPKYPLAFSPSGDGSEFAADDMTRRVMRLQSLLRVTYTSPRSMHWITEVLRLPLVEGGLTRDAAAQVIDARLRDYARQKVRENLFTEPTPTGFGIERIVYTYLDLLLAEGKSERLSADPEFVFSFRNSVEHFFPQHADTNDTGGGEVGTSDPEMNMLGNLALVSVSSNSKFSNALPLTKATKKRELLQSMKLRLMAEMTKADGVWDRKSITTHDGEMIDILRSDLGSET